MISLRCTRYTRRILGRRSLTPMRGKKRQYLKTRYSTKVVSSHVPILQQTNSLHDETRKEESQDKYCEDPKREGSQDGPPKRRWKDTEKHTQVIQKGDSADPEESLYPGTVHQMRELCECTDASGQTDAETEIEAEEVPS